MVNLSLAFRATGGLFLAAVFLIGIFIARVKMRQVQLHANEIPDAARQLFGYRMGSYLCALLFFVSLWAWVGLVLAVRFNWNRSDVSEIEILVFPSPDPTARAEKSISIKDRESLSRLFDGLGSLQPCDSAGHEHAVGKSYVLRLRRQSDGQWSSYRVKIYPDKEPTNGGMRMTGIYEVLLDVGSGRFNMGCYKAPELGRLVETLARSVT